MFLIEKLCYSFFSFYKANAIFVKTAIPFVQVFWLNEIAVCFGLAIGLLLLQFGIPIRGVDEALPAGELIGGDLDS